MSTLHETNTKPRKVHMQDFQCLRQLNTHIQCFGCPEHDLETVHCYHTNSHKTFSFLIKYTIHPRLIFSNQPFQIRSIQFRPMILVSKSPTLDLTLSRISDLIHVLHPEKSLSLVRLLKSTSSKQHKSNQIPLHMIPDHMTPLHIRSST